MHTMFADWYSEADREPSPERLQGRAAGVETFVAETNPDALLGLLRYLLNGTGDSTAMSALSAKLKEEDDAFLLRNNDHEMRVLSAISLILAIDNNSSVSTAIALAVDVASALGTAEVGPLSRVLVEMAQRHLTDEGLRLRVEPDEIAVTRFEKLAPDTNFSMPQQGADIPQVQANIAGLAEYVDGINGTINRALADTHTALAASTSFNAVLAEESSMLWWLMGAHSRDTNLPLAALSNDCVCLVAGKDLADLTRIIPGPVSVRAILHKALDSAGVDPTAVVELGTIVDAAARDWRADWLRGHDLTRLRGVGRCLPAVAASVEVGEEVDWHQLATSRDGIVLENQLSHLEWARLCYSECLLLRECTETE